MTRALVAFLGVMTLVGITAGAGELDRLPLGSSDLAYSTGSARAGQLYDAQTGKVVTEAEAIDRLAAARVILLGEDHTAIAQKQLQARLVDSLADRAPNLVLGMEFFQRGDDAVLARWTSDELNGDPFLLASDWYDRGGYNWVYYAPVMDEAQRRGLRVVGLNVPREIPRAVSHGGLEGLSPEQRAEVGDVETAGSPQHRYLISRFFGDSVALMPGAWFDRMYAAQCLWDVVMARSILAKLPADGAMVVVVGSGHVAYGLGIARRIHEELARRGEPDIRVATLCPVTAPAPEPGGQPHGHPMGDMGGGGADAGPPAPFARSLADIVAVFADTGGVEVVPRLGLTLEDGDNGTIMVKRAWPDTPSADAGLQKGDRIVDLNGVVPEDIQHLRLALARLRWGDRFDVAAQRDGKAVSAVSLLEPEVTSTEVSVAPGWTVSDLSTFDPSSPEPVTTTGIIPADDARSMRVVSRDGAPKRVEVWDGETLAEVHELDGSGRVVRSIFRSALPGGAVEVCYERAADGKVVSTGRFDRGGKQVGEEVVR